MANKFLDYEGVQTLWSTIKTKLADKAEASDLDAHGERISVLEQENTRREEEIAAKQDTLVSGTNIKTVNNTSLLGSGNVSITKSSLGLGNVLNVASYSKTETDEKIKAVQDQVTTILADAPEAYDTLKEISDYIASDTSGASSMLSSINSNTSRIGEVETGLQMLEQTVDANETAITGLQTDFDSSITGLSVSGKVITYTKGDGTTGTITTQDTDTNTQVTQAYDATTNASIPLLFSATSGVTSTSSRGATTAKLNNKFYVNPSTGTMTAPTFSGTLSGNASSATKATQDGDGNVISSTYSKVGHTHDPYINQNAFSNVTVGSTTIAADTTTDTLTLVAGSNITLTPDATNDKITIAATDTVYTHPSTHAASMITGLATVATSGSYNDLSNKPTIPTVPTSLKNPNAINLKVNSETSNFVSYDGSAAKTITVKPSSTAGAFIISDGTTSKTIQLAGKFTDNDTVYSHPAGGAASKSTGLYKFSTDATSHISTVTAVTKNDITALGIPAQDTTYSAATTSAAGLMSADDKSKLDGIASGANKYTHPTGTGSSKAEGLYKFSTDSGSHIKGVTAVTKDDITALGIPAQDTVYTLPTAANGTLGGVKTTSTVTSTSGLTACPIISGVPYYKNTTYSAAGTSLGTVKSGGDVTISSGVITVTAITADELAALLV